MKQTSCIYSRIYKKGVRFNITSNSIQFNSKTLFKYGDPVSLQLIFPGAIQTCEQYNNCSYIYTKPTQVHRTNTGKHNLHFHTKTYP